MCGHYIITKTTTTVWFVPVFFVVCFMCEVSRATVEHATSANLRDFDFPKEMALAHKMASKHIFFASNMVFSDSKSSQSGSESRVNQSDSQSQATSKDTSSEGSSPHYSPHNDFTIAREEDSAVFRVRLIVVVFLIACTIGVAFFVYFNTRNSELHEFEENFFGFSSKVLEAYEGSLDVSFAALDSFAVASVSIATSLNMSWPFVTIPNVGTRLSKVRSITKAAIIILVPHVQPSQKEEWNEYSLSHGRRWVDNNLKIQKVDPGFDGTQPDHYEVSPIWSDEEVSYPHMHYPIWHTYPSATTAIPAFNMDTYFLEDVKPALESLNGRMAFLSPVTNHPSRGSAYNNWLVDYVGKELNSTEPVSDLYYPVYDIAADVITLEDPEHSHDEHGDDKHSDDDHEHSDEEQEHSDEEHVQSNEEHEQLNGTLVAHIRATFYWRDLLSNILPTGIDGLVFVAENACNQSFTYQINGPAVVFLGFGDHHDPGYDYLAQSLRLTDLQEHIDGKYDYTALHPDDNPCKYHTTVYPSNTLKDLYTSSNPWVYATAAIAIFLFTSVVFWVYHILVERRQRKVMSTGRKI